MTLIFTGLGTTTIPQLGAQIAKILHENSTTVHDWNFEDIAELAASKLELSDNVARLVAIEASIISHALLDGAITAEEIT